MVLTDLNIIIRAMGDTFKDAGLSCLAVLLHFFLAFNQR